MQAYLQLAGEPSLQVDQVCLQGVEHGCHPTSWLPAHQVGTGLNTTTTHTKIEL